MTDTFAKTARPTDGAICWCDKTHIFIEYPVKGNNPPWIEKMPKNLESLQFAFGILREHPTAREQTRTVLSAQANHPAVKKISSGFSEAVNAEAASIVRRLLK